MNVEELYQGILDQDRSLLSKSITLIESSKVEHQILAKELINKILPHTGKSKRIGISGTPGVGKSTFIESFGSYLIEQGHKIAVLAVDPSSYLSGGSILGDKTRMPNLSYHNSAFVRPSPSSNTLGGVAKNTKEAMLLCEAFGFDYIIIETVGVGQSEVTVSSLTDHFLLLMQPAAGDELQGIKRGILELADSVVVNKADGDLLPKAKIAKAELDSSLHILRKAKFPITLCSALEKTGLDEVYSSLEAFFKDTKLIKEKRDLQRKAWLENLVLAELSEQIKKLINKQDLSKEENIPILAEKLIKKIAYE